MSRRQRLCILGSTGSVGCSTLDVVALHPERFEVHVLTAQRRVDALRDQCLQHRPQWAVVERAEDARTLQDALRDAGLRTEVLHGHQALSQVASSPDTDIVMAAIVGAAGLEPCLAAARAGKRLLLANKEALVLGGAFFMQAVRDGGAELLPIDSEHSAIFQCLPEDRGQWAARIDHIVLTASGGPFRTRPADTLDQVTPDEACAHPNWVMGRKISVDSASMMNKALEMIEARWLFDLAPSDIRVVLHPQSIVHSMVVCRDSSVMAQLGTPDMRVPIAVGLAWPHRIASGAATLDFTALADLTFEAADLRRFPALRLAREALDGPSGLAAVLNGANEVAVAAFLDHRLRFTDIHRVNEAAMDALAGHLAPQTSLEGILDADLRARAWAEQKVRELSA
ncbi:MAG: 1-deoxy-D-xylulose-5-phosphate reductoisomerase [Aquabacterium sp.]